VVKVRFEPTLAAKRQYHAIKARDLFDQADPPKLPPRLRVVMALPGQRHNETHGQEAQNQPRLTAFVETLEQKAVTEHEERYIEDLGESLEALRQERHHERQTTPLNWIQREELPHALLSGPKETLVRELEKRFKKSRGVARSLYKSIVAALLNAGGDTSTAYLLTHKHSPRVCTMFLICHLSRDKWPPLPNRWKRALIYYGVALAHVQRAKRLVRAARSGGSCNDLIRELEEDGHTNWDPLEMPEALLLEVESGIMIRHAQMQIAEHMRAPPGGGNAAMQLNMGEGKSSVIVPLVAAALADRRSTLVRVVVGKPQRQQMMDMLVAKLGGLLGRAIYHLPFSRALRLCAADTEMIRSMCEDCMRTGGVMLVQPEHLLSFKLMGTESLIAGKEEVGQSLLQTQHFFENQTRDIVDESDENFSVRFELIYTMGMQQPIDFSPERWIMIQQVLGLVRDFARDIKGEAPQDIELHDGGPRGCFPRTRLIRENAERLLVERIARHVCEHGLPGIPVGLQTEEVRNAVHTYITNRNHLSADDISRVEDGPFWRDTTQNHLLLLRGLLAGGVLGFALGGKRWRVNYGLDHGRNPPTQLAVPFRAKDNPTPRSEFSHPDVTIMLTCLSYYYGGLSYDDLFLAYDSVVRSDQAEEEYSAWMRDAPDLPEHFRTLQGINLKDTEQCRTEVFVHVRRAKAVVDYFLGHIVFPRLKQFPHKLSASGWDIGAVKTLPTTGFSGTVDSREVLPLDVEYCPLPEQKHTNALVLGHLLQPENGVVLLPPRQPGSETTSSSQDATPSTSSESDAETILSTVVDMKPPVRVLLDVGAQIIELDNKAVATRWLELTAEDGAPAEAVVFFDDHERMQVVDREGLVESFQISPYADQLDRCLVYLDESHTRGTDLRLPEDYRAAVTLGAGLTKDRLVQACMRMRKLGRGQSVVFCVPEEIAVKIEERERNHGGGTMSGGPGPAESGSGGGHKMVLAHRPKQQQAPAPDKKEPSPSPSNTATSEGPSVAQVLSWAIGETHEDLRRSMPLWADQGRRYEAQRALWDEVRTDGGFFMTADHAARFLEDEAQPLEARYRPRPPAVEAALAADQQDNPDSRLARIASRCKSVGSSSTDPASLQEEQERELSPEKEAERQVERPPQAEPASHKLHPHVRAFAETGELSLSLLSSSPAFTPAFEVLAKTGAAKYLDPKQFPGDLLATRDFATTVVSVAGHSALSADDVLDAFQRPVRWVLTSNKSGTLRGVIISPYEAHCLLAIRRRKPPFKTTLHVYSPRPNRDVATLERLDLHPVPALSPSWTGLPPTATRQLNLFAGQLYFSGMGEYRAVCAMLGLTSVGTGAGANQGGPVAADGFIEDEEERGMGDAAASAFSRSPVQFLKMFLSRVRRDCLAIEKTDVGRMLNGESLVGVLGEEDAE
jgi:hypothetical protein